MPSVLLTLAPADLATQAGRLRRLARAVLRDAHAAEDAAQDAFLAAARTPSARVANAMAWLAGAVRRIAAKDLRGRARRARRERAVARPEGGDSAAETLARIEARRRTLDAVARLDEPSRTVVVLRYLEGVPPREIARRQGVSVEAVKSRLRRGIERLRADLGATAADRRALAVTAAVGAHRSGGVPGPRGRVDIGGIVVTKKAAAAVGILLLLAFAGVYAVVRGDFLRDGDSGQRPPPAQVAPTSGTVDPSPPALAGAPPVPGVATSAVATGASVPPPSTSGAAASAAPDSTAAAAEGAGGDADAGREAVARSRFWLPKARTKGTGARGGSMGPTGHWTRFPPGAPPRGTARLVATVVDEGGKPVPGADVWLGRSDVLGVEGVSYGDLRSLGVTDAQGVLDVGDLPHGRAAVAADPWLRLAGPRGLDARSAVATVLRRNAVARVTVAVPLRLDALGTIEGRVVDGSGAALRRVRVAVGRPMATTGDDGAFTLRGVDAGPASASLSRFDLAPRTESVEVPAGGVARVTWTMAPKETGTRSLAGTVRGPDGETVAGATVYLIGPVAGGTGTLRSTISDASGGFAWRDLPEGLAKTGVYLTADHMRAGYGGGRLDLPDGLPSGPVEVRLDSRLTTVRLALVDAATGAPVGRVSCSLEPEQGRSVTISASYARPGTSDGVQPGAYEGWAPPGRYRLVVAPIDHARWEEPVEIPSSPTPVERTLRLARVRADSEDCSLTVDVRSAADGSPVRAVRVELLDGDPLDAVTRYEGATDDGTLRMAALTGTRTLRVSAEGFEPSEQALTVPPGGDEASVSVRLRPR